MKNYIYLLLTLILILIPIIFSLGKSIRVISKIKNMLPAIIFSGTIFIIWNMRFDELGIWNYNPDYLTGIQILRMPLEAWLFLFGISCYPLFIYEWVKIKFQHFEMPNFFLAISLVLFVLFGLLAFFSRLELYTFFTFFLLTIYFGYTIFRNRFKKHFTKFYVAFIIAVIPFIVIKSVLISLPAFSYNNMHIIGVHIFNVPVEDLGYFFLLFLMNTTIFEYLNERLFY